MLISPARNDTIELTSEQVRNEAKEILETQFEMEINGYKYTSNEIWDTLLYASASGKTINYACMNLGNAPSCNLVYTYLNAELSNLTLEEIERRCNDMIVSTLPPRLDIHPQKIAIDLVLIPYYGDVETEEIRRSKAKRSTTKFFCYATAYVIRKSKRVTLAFTFVRPSDTLFDVLIWLLRMVSDLGIRIKRLYLDREFARVDVISYLMEQSFVSIIAIPKKGDRIKSLLVGKKSYKTTYTMQSPKYGSVEFPLWIACRYSKGKNGKYGIERLPFAVIGDCTSPILHVADEYTHRFGIESSYRLMNQARARTSSRDAARRLLLVGIAFTLVNLWVYLNWFAVIMSRRRGTGFHVGSFPLALFCDFISDEVKRKYGFRSSIKL